MRRVGSGSIILFAWACLLLLTGCAASQPSKFYLLTPLPNSAGTGAIPDGKSRHTVGVGLVELAPYLDRPQIVTRTKKNELLLDEFHRWAEPLKDNFARVLTDNLSILLSGDQMAVYPWTPSVPTDFHVTVEVARFDTGPEGTTSLAARWRILAAGKETVLASKRASFSEPVNPLDYGAIVSAMSHALADLSREIALAIGALARKGSSPVESPIKE